MSQDAAPEKFDEALIYDYLLLKLKKEVEKWEKKAIDTPQDAATFEKLVKAYCNLKDDLRRDLEADTYALLHGLKGAGSSGSEPRPE